MKRTLIFTRIFNILILFIIIKLYIFFTIPPIIALFYKKFIIIIIYLFMENFLSFAKKIKYIQSQLSKSKNALSYDE